MDFEIWRNQILMEPQNISPLKFGMSQDEIINIFGKSDSVSTMRRRGKHLILKYYNIEFHFGVQTHGLHLILVMTRSSCALQLIIIKDHSNERL